MDKVLMPVFLFACNGDKVERHYLIAAINRREAEDFLLSFKPKEFKLHASGKIKGLYQKANKSTLVRSYIP